MKKKILLIDDDVLVAKTLSNLLTRKGYEVTVAHTADEAVTSSKNASFDLVISDIRMPGKSGIWAIGNVKETLESRGIHAAYLFITGFPEEDTPAHAIRLGVNKILFKPFDTDEFLGTIVEEISLLEEEERLRTGPVEAPVRIKKKPKKQIPLCRAVITGVGCVTPGGIGKSSFWQSLREGRNCIDQISFFDASRFPSKMAAEIKDFRPSDFIREHSEIKRMARSSQLAVAAAKLALADAKISGSEAADLSVIVGSSTSGVEYLLPEAYLFERGGLQKVGPYVGIAGFAGSISSEISRFTGAKGLSHTLSTGCTSSTDAMGHTLRQIQYGLSDVVITGGADACVNDGILAAFCRMGAVSTRNGDYKKASRPFNKDRDGFVIAEGAWIFVVEELECARARKATIYAELLGYGATCDAWHMAKPHPSGEQAALAIQMALEDAGVGPEQVDIFEAYGNSTRINDTYETSVIKRVFGTHAPRLVVPSIKSMLGHPIGAAGAGQVAAALMALHQGFIHPTINYEVPDPECDLDYVPNKGREGKFEVALCNSLAFGGKNACLALRSFRG